MPLTQEFLADMLGTRRSSVTVAAGDQRKAGLISYTRGEVNVVNEDARRCILRMLPVDGAAVKIWEQESKALSAKTVPYGSRNAIRISVLDLG